MTAHDIRPARSADAADGILPDVEAVTPDMVSNAIMRRARPSARSGWRAADEMAVARGMDPIALRLRDEPEKDPTIATPLSSRDIVEADPTGSAGVRSSR